MRKKIKAFIFLNFAILVLASQSNAGIIKKYDVREFGAKGNGRTLDTDAIQKAIDAAGKDGGGEVFFPPGNYLSVELKLRSGVSLYIGDGAALRASPYPDDWGSCNLKPLVSASSQHDISIKGNGVIDGSSGSYYDERGNFIPGFRPQTLITVNNSGNVSVSGITLQNSVRWTQVYNECDGLAVTGVKVRNHEFGLARETDGIDINSSRNVIVQDCDIETGDDGICLKPQPDSWHKQDRDMHDVTVKNCIVASTCNALKIGTGTSVNIYNVSFENITVKKHADVETGSNPVKSDIFGSENGTCIAAISVQSNDGGFTHDISFRNISILSCDTPIFIETQNRQSFVAHPDFGEVYNISFTNISCSHSSRASQINTEKGGHVRSIVFENLSIHNFETYRGKSSPYRLTGAYPDANKYGRMPAYGLFARDTQGLKISKDSNFYDDGGSKREAMVFENATLE